MHPVIQKIMMTMWRMTAWEKLNPSVHQKRIGGRIANELLMTLRSNKKQAREVSLSEPIGSDREGNEITLLDVIETEDEAVEDRLHEEDKRNLLKGFLFAKLSGREREILLYRYGLYGYPEITQREIADRFKISRSYVSRIEKKALSKLRECYDTSEIAF